MPPWFVKFWSRAICDNGSRGKQRSGSSARPDAVMSVPTSFVMSCELNPWIISREWKPLEQRSDKRRGLFVSWNEAYLCHRGGFCRMTLDWSAGEGMCGVAPFWMEFAAFGCCDCTSVAFYVKHIHSWFSCTWYCYFSKWIHASVMHQFLTHFSPWCHIPLDLSFPSLIAFFNPHFKMGPNSVINGFRPYLKSAFT